MRQTHAIALLFSLTTLLPMAQAETLHCYVGVGSNEFPSCEARPAALDFGTLATMRAYDTPDFRLILRPSTQARGAYDSTLSALKPEGYSTFVFQTMIATRQGLQIQTAPGSPFTSTQYEPGPGTNLFFKAGAPDFSHPALFKTFRGTLAFIDNVDGGKDLFVGVGMLKAIICSKATPQGEADWRDFVAHFSERCAN